MKNQRISILASPAHSNRGMNPHQHLLYSALESLGASVVEFGFNTRLLRRFDIFHVHWPELIVLRKSSIDSWLHFAAFAMFMLICKLRGTKLVWTVNNLRAHDSQKTRLDKTLWYTFPRLVDLYIALSEPTRLELLKAYPSLRGRRGAVIPRGHYRDSYPDDVSKTDARLKMALPPDAKVFAYIGLIRPYKNVPELISVFRQLEGPDYRLVIAGKCSSWELEAEIRQQMDSDDRISFHNHFIPDDQLQYIVKAADVVTLPYKDILNSGSALLALSFNRPVILPRLGTNLELQDEFGHTWVKLYAPQLTKEFIQASMAEALSAQDKTLDMAHRDWSQVAGKVMKAYQDLMTSAKP